MKIRYKLVIITALCLAVFALGSCDYWEPADQGSINISFDDSNARTVLDSDKPNMIYTITLTSPGKETIARTTEKGVTSISIPVSGGEWSIQVHGEGTRRIGEGTAYVTVTAGKPASAIINMNVTGTKAYNLTDLGNDFTDNSLPSNYSIELIFDSMVDSSNEISLDNGKTLSLWSKTDVTIKKTRGDKAIFRVLNGTLILDGSKGKITLDGNKDNVINSHDKALIDVVKTPGTSTLKIYDGITITNNKTQFGGGVYVSGNTSSFYMYGGIISRNISEATSANGDANGGGVSIKADGYFYKSGGTVYGNDGGDDKNTGKGAAVFCESTDIAYDLTLNNNLEGNLNIH